MKAYQPDFTVPGRLWPGMAFEKVCLYNRICDASRHCWRDPKTQGVVAVIKG